MGLYSEPLLFITGLFLIRWRPLIENKRIIIAQSHQKSCFEISTKQKGRETVL